MIFVFVNGLLLMGRYIIGSENRFPTIGLIELEVN